MDNELEMIMEGSGSGLVFWHLQNVGLDKENHENAFVKINGLCAEI
jgi:hypothetical protein